MQDDMFRACVSKAIPPFQLHLPLQIPTACDTPTSAKKRNLVAGNGFKMLNLQGNLSYFSTFEVLKPQPQAFVSPSLGRLAIGGMGQNHGTLQFAPN